MPALQGGHCLGKRSLLDAPSHVQLLLDALAGMCFLLEASLTGLNLSPHAYRRRNLRDEVCEADHILAIRLDVWVVRRAIHGVTCDQQPDRPLWFTAQRKRDILGHLQDLPKRKQNILIAPFRADYSLLVSQDQGKRGIVLGES